MGFHQTLIDFVPSLLTKQVMLAVRDANVHYYSHSQTQTQFDGLYMSYFILLYFILTVIRQKKKNTGRLNKTE